MTHVGIALIDPHKIFSAVGLSKGMRVADFGCGRTGHFVFVAAKVVEDVGVVYAVDIMKEVLENIKSRVRSEGFDNVQIIWSDIESEGKTPIAGGSLDVCFFVNVVSQLKNRTAALKEAMRLLKPGGKVVVVDWSKKIGPLGPEEDKMLNPGKVSMLGSDCGFTVEGTGSAGDYHFYSILKKI
jgi:ubiquinone/menaquinone biosynthesis C-methylase UbiE